MFSWLKPKPIYDTSSLMTELSHIEQISSRLQSVKNSKVWESLSPLEQSLIDQQIKRLAFASDNTLIRMTHKLVTLK